MLEAQVGRVPRFLSIFDANQAQILGKFDQSAFDSNLQQLRERHQSREESHAGNALGGLAHSRRERISATDRSPFQTKGRPNPGETRWKEGRAPPVRRPP
jgi:hypothetical protein